MVALQFSTIVKTAALLALVLGVGVVTASGQVPGEPDKKLFVDYQVGFLTEGTLRHDAQITVMPVYPEEAITNGAEGLVDVAVMFDENGEWKLMEILESPHPAISKAVGDALKQWKIKVFHDSPDRETSLPIRPLAEVRFHFSIREGVPTVEPATNEEQQRGSRQFTDYVNRMSRCLNSDRIKNKLEFGRCFDQNYLAKIPI